MSLLVHIPYYCTDQELFNKAVKSILKQSYSGDYEVLITTDGCTPNAKEALFFSHPRLKFFEYNKNHGRYFCDAVAVLANPHEFYLPHDSDDESNYQRLFHLIKKQKETDADAVFHYQRVITRTGKTIRETYPLMQHPQYETMRHIAHWSGLYKTRALRGIGGPHPDYKVGYDTLLVNFIRARYKVATVPRFLYTRNTQTDSLTTSKKTGFGSPHRKAAIKRLTALYDKAYAKPQDIKKIVEASIKPSTMSEVKREVKRLKKEVWGL